MPTPPSITGNHAQPNAAVFVTGGSGFLGRRLVARLKEESYTVTALSRSPKSDSILQALGASTVRGELTDIDVWQDALRGQDVVVHAASPIGAWGDWNSFERDIAQASLDLYRAAGRNDVRRYIQISSEAVLQGDGPLLDVCEDHPYPGEPNSLYGRAKKQAEEGLLAQATGTGTECIILRPAFIWGQGGEQLDQVVEKVRRGQFIWIDNGDVPMEMVHVDNVVEAVRLALTHGKAGEVYWVTDGRQMTAREFLGALLGARGIVPPDRSMAGSVARPVAAALESVWRLLRRKSVPPLSRFQLDFIALPRRYDLSKSKRELQYQPIRTFEEGIAEMQEGARI